ESCEDSMAECLGPWFSSGLKNALTALGKVLQTASEISAALQNGEFDQPGDMLMLLFYCIRISNY
ncbi:MAG: hypothetical protein ACREV8_02390, partial [Gammaproteobacteria bacterium]